MPFNVSFHATIWATSSRRPTCVRMDARPAQARVLQLLRTSVLGLCYHGHAQSSNNGHQPDAVEGIAVVPEKKRGP